MFALPSGSALAQLDFPPHNLYAPKSAVHGEKSRASLGVVGGEGENILWCNERSKKEESWQVSYSGF